MPKYGAGKLQFYYGGQWNDAPLADPKRGSVSVTRGRGPEQEQASPSSLTAPVDNFTGNYNPRSAVSSLFGKIGRNTPTRFYLGSTYLLGAGNSDVSNVTSQVAPSLTAPAAGLLICAWASPFNVPSGQSYTLPGSMSASGVGGTCDNLIIQGGRQNVTAGATGTRTATISTADEYVAASVFIKGPTTWSTGTLAPAGTSFTLDVVDPGDLWVVITAFASNGDTNPPVAPAFPADTDGGGWQLLADTGNVQWDDGAAKWGRMKAWVKKGRTVNNTHTITLPGADDGTTVSFATRVPAANVVSDWDIRAVGEAASWEPNRTGDFVPNTRGDAWTGLSAAGLLRRLGQGADPLLLPLRRAVLQQTPLAYWPMEDGDQSTQLSSAVAGQPPLTKAKPRVFISVGTGEVDYAAIDDVPVGSFPLPLFPTAEPGAAGPFSYQVAASLSGSITGYMRLSYLGRLRIAANNIPVTFFFPMSGGSITQWGFGVGGDQVGITLTDPVNPDPHVESTTGWDDNSWHWFEAEVTQSGSDVLMKIYIDGNLNASATATGVTLGQPEQFGAQTDSDPVDNPEELLQFGHIAVWDTPPDADAIVSAIDGFTGETVVERFLRLCAEEGIPASVLGTDTHTMGPQPSDTLPNQFTELELTGGGFVYEPREQLGLVYRTVGSLYAQDPALELDWASGKMAPLSPVIDDRYTRNDISAGRRSGSAPARAVQTTGPLNVNDPTDDVNGVGRYTSQVIVNPEDDDDLPNLARWYLHLGTVDETRFPTVTVDLDLYDTVAAVAAAVDIGDRITIANAPVDLSPDLIDLIVVGYTERITPTRRTIDFNCVPASSYRVAVADGTKRVDAAATVVNAAKNTTETSWTMRVDDGNFWATSGVFPFDIMAGGERMTVTAIGAPSGNLQVFTVQRSKNGVVKSHAANEPVHVVDRSFVAL